MTPDIHDIEINRIIFHAVPSKHVSSTETLILSSIEGDFGPRATNFFRRRLVSELIVRAHSVVFYSSLGPEYSTVSGLVLSPNPPIVGVRLAN